MRHVLRIVLPLAIVAMLIVVGLGTVMAHTSSPQLEVAHVQGNITGNVSIEIGPTTGGSPVTVKLTAGQTVTAVYNSQTQALESLMVRIRWPNLVTLGTWPNENVAHVDGNVTGNVSIGISPTTGGSPVTVELTAGQAVTAVYNSQTQALESLMVSIPWPTLVTAKTWPNENVAHVEGNVTANVSIEIAPTTGGSPVTVELTAEQTVTALYNNETQALESLMVSMPWPTLVTPRTWPNEDVTHVGGNVTGNVSIEITPTTGGSPVTVELTAGQTVTALYNSQTQALESLMVRIPWPTLVTPGTWPNEEVKGIISAINETVTPPTVSITPKEGSPVVLKVDSSTIITKAGIGKATLDDLATNDRAVATYNKDTMVASRILVSQPLEKYHSFVGNITSKSDDSFVVTTQKGDVTITVNNETKYEVPGVNNATLENFNVGDKVAVLVVEVTTGSVVENLALHVNLIPGKPIYIHRVGIIEDYQAGSNITLKDKKGESSTFIVTGDTKIIFKKGATDTEPKVGDWATVIARRDPAIDQFTAKAIIDFGSKKS
jgi:hypothetical protein